CLSWTALSIKVWLIGTAPAPRAGVQDPRCSPSRPAGRTRTIRSQGSGVCTHAVADAGEDGQAVRGNDPGGALHYEYQAETTAQTHRRVEGVRERDTRNDDDNARTPWVQTKGPAALRDARRISG